MSLNKPFVLIPIGLIMSMLSGTVIPSFGVIWTKMLFLMQPNLLDPTEEIDMIKMRNYALIMLGVSFAYLIMPTISWFIFGILGESMTKKVRIIFYESLLKKPISWFDKRENSAGVLTMVLSSEIRILNGVSTELISSIIE